MIVKHDVFNNASFRQLRLSEHVDTFLSKGVAKIYDCTRKSQIGVSKVCKEISGCDSTNENPLF